MPEEVMKKMNGSETHSNQDLLKASKYPKEELTMYTDLNEGLRKSKFYEDYQKVQKRQRIEKMRNCRYQKSQSVAANQTTGSNFYNEKLRENEIKQVM